MSNKAESVSTGHPLGAVACSASLLPCPFCGGEAKLTHESDIQQVPKYRGEWHFVKCLWCGVVMPVTSDLDAAIAMWQRRESQNIQADPQNGRRETPTKE